MSTTPRGLTAAANAPVRLELDDEELAALDRQVAWREKNVTCACSRGRCSDCPGRVMRVVGVPTRCPCECHGDEGAA